MAWLSELPAEGLDYQARVLVSGRVPWELLARLADVCRVFGTVEVEGDVTTAATVLVIDPRPRTPMQAAGVDAVPVLGDVDGDLVGGGPEARLALVGDGAHSHDVGDRPAEPAATTEGAGAAPPAAPSRSSPEAGPGVDDATRAGDAADACGDGHDRHEVDPVVSEPDPTGRGVPRGEVDGAAGAPRPETRAQLVALLAEAGPVVDVDGRVTRILAETLGWDIKTTSSVLARAVDAGVIVRQVRGRRTYRVELAPASSDGGDTADPGRHDRLRAAAAAAI